MNLTGLRLIENCVCRNGNCCTNSPAPTAPVIKGRMKCDSTVTIMSNYLKKAYHLEIEFVKAFPPSIIGSWAECGFQKFKQLKVARFPNPQEEAHWKSSFMWIFQVHKHRPPPSPPPYESFHCAALSFCFLVPQFLLPSHSRLSGHNLFAPPIPLLV